MCEAVKSQPDLNRSDTVWNDPPRVFSLAAGPVQVWRFSLELEAARAELLWPLLTEEEAVRARRFYFEKHRRRFLVGRAFLRLVLGRYLQREPQALRFTYGGHGKPAVEDAGDLHFNLSHSGEAGLLGVTRGREIGADIEEVRPRDSLMDIARRFFAPEEVATLSALAPAEQQLAFFLCWTRKEAFLKAGGEGLARPLDQFTVSLKPGEPARLTWVATDPAEAARWTLHSLTPGPNLVACVALRDHGWPMQCFDGKPVLDTQS
jgi:4'-phosphopantetheinyl transferase